MAKNILKQSPSGDEFRRLRPSSLRQTALRFSLLLALGPALVFLLFIAVRGEQVYQVGEILKPMTFPVIIGVFILPLRWSLGLCFSVPILTYLLTLGILGHGIPPMNWMHGYRLIVELLFTVLTIYFCHRALGMSWWLAVVVGAVLNRSVGLFLAAITLLRVEQSEITFTLSSVVFGIVGFVFPLAAIQVLRMVLKPKGLLGEFTEPVSPPPDGFAN